VDQCVGYKEWVAVSDALLEGRQHLLLRKGGIHEGRKGFSFRHDAFAVFPTRFHAQAAQIRGPRPEGGGADEWEVGEEVFFEVWCEAVWAHTLSDWNQVKALEPFHIWTEDLVRERFDCGDVQQIHCALVRVYRLTEPFTVPYAKGYGGCRTWVNLPVRPPELMEPVVEDSAFEAARTAIETILS
tara:strand:+ start:3662 stop:4216 length:555 start_codon:yes stop_codon:yes gene_type:complete